MKKDKKAKSLKRNEGIESYMEKLDVIVENLESGDIELEQAIENYEEGMKLIEKCRGVLKTTKLKIEKLKKTASKTDPEGEYVEDDGYAVEPDVVGADGDDDDDDDDGALPF